MNPLPFNLITPQSPGQERNRLGNKIAVAKISPFEASIALPNPACRMCHGLLKRQDFRRTEGPAICIAQAERLGKRRGEQTQQEGPTARRSIDVRPRCGRRVSRCSNPVVFATFSLRLPSRIFS